MPLWCGSRNLVIMVCGRFNTSMYIVVTLRNVGVFNFLVLACWRVTLHSYRKLIKH